MLFFCLFQCFEEKEYQTESKWDKTFGSDLFVTNTNQETWSGRQEANEAATTVPGAPSKGGRPPPSWAPRGSTDLLLTPIYIHVAREHPGAPLKPNSTAATFCIHEIPSWSLRRRSAGGEIDHGGPLHHLQDLSDEL